MTFADIYKKGHFTWQNYILQISNTPAQHIVLACKERITAAPQKGHFTWEKGHFTWEKGHFTWEKGHFTWEAKPVNPHKIRLFGTSKNPNILSIDN